MAGEAESSGSPWWPWLLLAAVVAGGVGWALVAAGRRRTWDASFEQALAKARAVVDTLVPSLLDRSVPAAVLLERWRGSQGQLDELQNELARLGGSAAGTQRGDRVAQVSGAATALRQAVAADVTLRSGTDVTTPSEADLTESRNVALARSDALLAAIENRPGPVASGGSSATGAPP